MNRFPHALPRPGTGPRPTLLVVAHGSRDPRHAATVARLCARLRLLAPGARVEAAHLDFNAPSVPQVLERLHAEAVAEGRQRCEVVALPLLLTRAFHARTDIPAVLRDSARALPRLSVTQAEVLGPDALLVAALERRLREAGVRPGDIGSTGVVLAAAGSSDPEAIAVIADVAREWRRTTGWCAVRPAFASASGPRTEEAVRALRTEGVRRIAVAPYVIAPGRLPDRIAAGALEGGADLCAPVLGDAPEIARLLLRRAQEQLHPSAAGRGGGLLRGSAGLRPGPDAARAA
ncbi:sirohydrochlorin chelatase [Streptomyces sp. XM4193]|uniref:sirohydrochlorin chelatase n=1 Tax=Streptomyces sp. XM4193 TaxID=2929782 RepID=UPI001FFC22E7|nr:sirohydrochlorin chelatase [Streptomyces sp. XM4193]MCK1797115.1 sirohydrochlorin chelatase [Streptomyces sp. XM4193]